MICPECGDEFRQDLERCPDCDVDLVAKPEPGSRSEPDHSESVELFRSSDPGLLAIAKSILDGASIPYSVDGEESMALFGSTKSFSSRLDVPQARRDEAMALMVEADLDVGLNEREMEGGS